MRLPRRRTDVLHHPRAGLALDPAQPAAQLPDRTRHRDRRRGGDHHGHAGPGRDAVDPEPDRRPGQQPAAGAPGPAPDGRPRQQRLLWPLLSRGRCRGDRDPDRRRACGGTRSPHQHHRGRQRPQLEQQRDRQPQRLALHRQLAAARRARVQRRRVARGCRRLPDRRDGAARALRQPQRRRRAAARAADVVRGGRPAAIQGAGRLRQRPGRPGAAADQDAAAARDRQHPGPDPAGVDAGR